MGTLNEQLFLSLFESGRGKMSYGVLAEIVVNTGLRESVLVGRSY